MLINVSIQIADACADIALNNESDVSFSRQEFAAPERIVYSIQLLNHEHTQFDVLLHKIDADTTAVTFPVRIPDYLAVFRPPIRGIGLVTVTQEDIPTSFENETEERTYRICSAICYQLKQNEGLLNRRSTSKRGDTGDRSVAKLEEPTRRTLLDHACIEWVNRGYAPALTREEFLQDFLTRTGHYISLDQFKAALRDACRRGLIMKENRRFRPKK